MATNRASLSDTLATDSRAQMSGVSRGDVSDRDTPRRTGMVVGGFVLALVSLIAAWIGLSQVWLAPNAANGTSAQPFLQSWEASAVTLFGGLGLAAGAALIGIGMGRWGSPRPPTSDADYTGPGIDADDAPGSNRVV